MFGKTPETSWPVSFETKTGSERTNVWSKHNEHDEREFSPWQINYKLFFFSCQRQQNWASGILDHAFRMYDEAHDICCYASYVNWLRDSTIELLVLKCSGRIYISTYRVLSSVLEIEVGWPIPIDHVFRNWDRGAFYDIEVYTLIFLGRYSLKELHTSPKADTSENRIESRWTLFLETILAFRRVSIVDSLLHSETFLREV